MDLLAKPFRLQILRGYVFRQNNPAVFGVEIMAGTLRPNSGMMKADGRQLATIKSVQLEQKNVEKAEKGKQVAISVPHITVGRQVNEGDILYSFIPEQDFRKLKEFKEFLSEEEKEILREIAKIMRKKNPVWGV